MKSSSRALSVAIVTGLFLAACRQSGLQKQAWYKGQVEVAPGIFTEVDERSVSSDDGVGPVSWERLHTIGKSRRGQKFTETCEMRVNWQGTNVHWKSNSVPLNLRVFDGKLYLITFDRVKKIEGECVFRYYAQQGNELKEVAATTYPKAIAGQNMGFDNRYFGAVDRQRDSVQIARDQDPTDIYFRTSLTAYIWNQLATGEQYEQSQKKADIGQRLFEDYIRTNKPVKLNAIIRDGSNGLSGSRGDCPPRPPHHRTCGSASGGSGEMSGSGIERSIPRSVMQCDPLGLQVRHALFP